MFSASSIGLGKNKILLQVLSDRIPSFNDICADFLYVLGPNMSRNILVLWRWSEAVDSEGDDGDFSSIGGQMKAVQKGDCLYIGATKNDELYLLGMLLVKEVKEERNRGLRALFGKYRANCQNVGGPFKILPLGERKWKLRFVNTKSNRLSPKVRLASQLQAHRSLSDESADLLAGLLGEKSVSIASELSFIEGEKRTVQTLRTVRDPALRLEAKRHWGLRCYCCGFSFEEYYGAAGEDFAIIHHLDPFSNSDGKSRETTVKDVRIVCANCHCILHRKDPPEDVEKLRRQIVKIWTSWSHKGVRAR